MKTHWHGCFQLLPLLHSHSFLFVPPKTMKTFLFRWLPVILLATVIFIASSNPDPYKPLPASWSQPTNPAEPLRPTRDELFGRVLHVGEYAVLAALTARALIWKREIRVGSLMVALGLTALYALSDEIHQIFVPGRRFEWFDLGLDSLGAVIGLMGYAFLHTFLSRRNPVKTRNYESPQ